MTFPVVEEEESDLLVPKMGKEGIQFEDKPRRTLIYMQTNGHPKKLLPNSNEFQKELPNSEESPDLTLRLSLGNIHCGGSKIPKEKNPLSRSSSLAGLMITRENNIGIGTSIGSEISELGNHPGLFLSLSRSCSLPSETEQQGLFMLKEWHSMRRMEEEGKKKKLEEVEILPPGPQPELAAWTAKSPTLCRAIVNIKSIQECLPMNPAIEEGVTRHGPMPPSLKRSSSSSHLSPEQGTDIESRKPPSAINRLQQSPSKKAKILNAQIQESAIDVMKMMPTVTTMGDGPNGRKVEGFLYRYTKGQVSIVCVCHGSFLSPAEFVKHAGGKEVANPMKHIQVCSTSFAF